MSLVAGQNPNGIMNSIPAGLLPGTAPFSTKFKLSDVSYDWAIAGIPFLAGETLRGTYFRRQYIREFAPIRKDQFDNRQVPGEQSILGWWLHSQGSFPLGAGVQFLDTTEDQTLGERCQYSEGLDILGTPGQTTLLQATKTIVTGLTGPVRLRGVQKSGTDGVLVLDAGAKTLKFVTAAGSVTNYTMPGGLTGVASTLTDDGTNYYFADNTGIYKGTINTPGAAATLLWNVPVGALTFVLAWVKGRLCGGLGNQFYELAGGAPPALPAPKFSHFNQGYAFTDISEIPSAILASGSVGGFQSQVNKFTLDNSGALPVLSSGVVTVTMPVGEAINRMYAYLGTYVGLATTKGFRVATGDVNGNLTYGPLIVQDPTGIGVDAIAGYDRFFFLGNQGNNLIPQQGWSNPSDASPVDMLLRVDMSQTTTTGSQPFANDLMTSGLDGTITDITNFGESLSSVGMLAFATGTKVWVTDTANKQATGFLYTSKIRYDTLEPKHFKFIYLRNKTISDGSISISAQNSTSPLTNLISNVTGNQDPSSPVFIPDIGNAQEWMEFKFTINRGSLSANTSPVWNGYQLRALPGVNRQLLLTLPLVCTNMERDNQGGIAGYDTQAKDRLLALEAAVGNGNLVTVQDLQEGVDYIGFMEEYRFEQQANPQKTEPLGGYILLQMRIVL